MDKWYGPFIVGFAVCLILYVLKDDVEQAMYSGLGSFIGVFIVYLVRLNKRKHHGR